MVLRLSRRSFVHGTMLSREGARRHGSFTELLAGIKLAKAHDAEDRYAAEYLGATRDIRRQVLRHTGERTRTRSEEHTSELQSLMRISYAVFCLKKKNNHTIQHMNLQP